MLTADGLQRTVVLLKSVHVEKDSDEAELRVVDRDRVFLNRGDPLRVVPRGAAEGAARVPAPTKMSLWIGKVTGSREMFGGVGTGVCATAGRRGRRA